MGATPACGAGAGADTQPRMFSNPVAEKVWNLWAYPETFVYIFEGKYRIKCPVCDRVLESESETGVINKAIAHAQIHLTDFLVGMEMGMRI